MTTRYFSPGGDQDGDNAGLTPSMGSEHYPPEYWIEQGRQDAQAELALLRAVAEAAEKLVGCELEKNYRKDCDSPLMPWLKEPTFQEFVKSYDETDAALAAWKEAKR